MKRILIFSLAYYPNSTSGAEAAVKEITDRIGPAEIEFHMVTLRYNSLLPRVEKVGHVLVHRIGLVKENPSFIDLGKLPLDLNKPLFQFLAPYQAARLHHRYHYDAVWAIMAHSAGVPAAIFKMTHRSVKYILTLQEGDPVEYIERKMKPAAYFFKRAFSLADLVQPISNYLANWARQRGVNEGKIKIIHNGANPRDLANSIPASELDSLKRKMGKQPGDIFLVNTARLVNQKANDDVIRALASLPKNIKFLIVGDGPEENNLKKLAEELQVRQQVIFAGRVDRTQVTKYRLISDILVCPSRSEGLGNAFLSAMASGLPVVATQQGGLADFIFDEKRDPGKAATAWAVDPDSPEQITEAIRDILSHPEKAKKITTAAKQMVQEKYNWDKIASQMRSQVFSVCD